MMYSVDDVSDIKKDSIFNKRLDLFLRDFEKDMPYCDESIGRSITTCSDNDIFFKIDGPERHMMRWFYQTLQKYYSHVKRSPYEIYIKRNWINRCFEGTAVKPHLHCDPDLEVADNEEHLVVILYYDCEPNASELVLISGGIIKDSIHEYHRSQRHGVNIEPGLAVVHPNSIIHSVDEMKSETPRTCFVFDIKCVFEDSIVEDEDSIVEDSE